MEVGPNQAPQTQRTITSGGKSWIVAERVGAVFALFLASATASIFAYIPHLSL